MSPPNSGAGPRVLLVGYNGANNTGSEARLLVIIDEIRSSLGQGALITVPTLNQKNLRRYVTEEENLRIAPIPPIYNFTMRGLVRAHDIVILVEGSCFMDTWAYLLLWAFLDSVKLASRMGKLSMAYAVDSGRLSEANKRRVRREASKMDLIIVRSHAAADRLRSWGVTAPIEVTGDSAFLFDVEERDVGTLRKEWPEAGSRVAGFAVVDFYLWPVVMRPWGRRSRCYKWPYYFSRSRRRCAATEMLANSIAAEADRVFEEHGMSVALICMEQIDEALAHDVLKRMKHSKMARVFSSSEYNSSQMTAILRNLDLLVTSRYHASVLSMRAQVPQMAIGHDLRLEDLYGEIGLRDGYFLRYDAPGLWEGVRARVDALASMPDAVKAALRKGNQEQTLRAKRNRELFTAFVDERGWGAR